MMASERASISLCHEGDARAASACVRFAYSIGMSLSKFRPVVRNGSISQGGACRREHLYDTSACDRPATVSQRLRSLARIVKCDSGTDGGVGRRPLNLGNDWRKGFGWPLRWVIGHEIPDTMPARPSALLPIQHPVIRWSIISTQV
jgi:hypothetical protein